MIFAINLTKISKFVKNSKLENNLKRKRSGSFSLNIFENNLKRKRSGSFSLNFLENAKEIKSDEFLNEFFQRIHKNFIKIEPSQKILDYLVELYIKLLKIKEEMPFSRDSSIKSLKFEFKRRKIQLENCNFVKKEIFSLKKLLFFSDFFAHEKKEEEKFFEKDHENPKEKFIGKISEITEEKFFENLKAFVNFPKENSDFSKLIKRNLQEITQKFEENHRLCEKEANFFELEYNLIPIFIYISLIVNNVPVVPNDVILWIKQQKIPYLEGAGEFLESPLR